MVTPEQIDEELVDKIYGATVSKGCIRTAIRQTLWWLANNPIEPTVRQADKIGLMWNDGHLGGGHYTVAVAKEFKRIAYLKKEPELPAELKALLMNKQDLHINQAADNEREANARIIEAYKLGQQSKGE